MDLESLKRRAERAEKELAETKAALRFIRDTANHGQIFHLPGWQHQLPFIAQPAAPAAAAIYGHYNGKVLEGLSIFFT